MVTVDTVAVPSQYLSTLTTRWGLYKGASTVMRPTYRSLLQSMLTQCTAKVNETADPDYPTTAPEEWAFVVEPDTVSIYPGVQEGSPLALLYPVPLP
jgi:hypothetical protein